jgi:hypothetical protein
LFEVENTAHGDEAACFVPDEINRVRKALGRSESIGAHSLTENLRRGGDYTEFSFDALDNRVAESGGAFFLPPKTLAEIGLRPRRNDQSRSHDTRVTRTFTSGQGEPSAGLA